MCYSQYASSLRGITKELPLREKLSSDLVALRKKTLFVRATGVDVLRN